MELEELVLRIRVMAEQADIAVDDVRGALEGLDQANEKSGKVATQAGQQAQKAYQQQGRAAQTSAMEVTAAVSAIAVVSKKAFDVIIEGITKGIEANNRYIASLQGVQSVASGRGISTEQMQGALDQLTDKFFDVTAAATSLKNLLSRGYSLEQAVAAINAFKNSAAFGRQASLSLSQAVVSATEGIKNENSILVDNAGVTKNVAKMWEEYAKARGLATAELTQAQKIEAEYAGIMQETRFQMGDLAKLSGTLAGSQAEAAMAGELVSRAYGASMAPAVGVATEAYTGFLNTVRGVTEAMPGAAAGLTTMGLAASVLVGILPAGAIALELFKTKILAAAGGATIFGASMGAAMPWLLGISAVIGLITAVYTEYVNSQKAAAEAAAEAAAKQKEHMAQLQAENTSLSGLKDRYTELSGKKKLTYSETKELAGIEKALESQYGITVTSLQNVAGAYDQVSEAIDKKVAANEAELQVQRALDSANAKTAADAAQANAVTAEAAMADLIAKKQDYAEKLLKLNAELAAAMMYTPKDPIDKDTNETLKVSLRDAISTYQGYLDELEPKIENEKAIIARASEAWGLVLSARLEEIRGAIEEDAGTESFAQMLAQRIWGEKSAAGFTDSAAAQAAAQQLVDSFNRAIAAADLSETQATVDDYYKRVMNGVKLTDDELAAFSSTYQLLQDGAAAVGKAFDLTGEQVQDALLTMYPDLQAFAGGVEEWYTKMQQFDPSKIIGQLSKGDASGLSKITDEVKKQSDAYNQLSDKLKVSGEITAALRTVQTEWGNVTSDTYRAAQEVIKEYYDNYITSEAQIGPMLDEELQKRQAIITQWNAQAQEYNATVGMLETLRAAVVAVFGEQSEYVGILDEAIINLKQDFRDMTYAANSGLSNTSQAIKDVSDAAAAVGSMQNKLDTSSNMVTQISNWKKIVKAYQDGKGSAEDYQKALKAMGKTSETVPKDALKAIGDLEKGLASDVASMESDLAAMRVQLVNLQNDSNINGTATLEISSLLASIGTAEARIAALRALAAASGVPLKSGGGGGGGQSKYQKDIAAMEHEANMAADTIESLNRQLAQLEALQGKYTNRRGQSTLKLDDQRDLDERIYSMREEIRSRNLEAEYDDLDHKKALNQITLQDELATLERIKAAHQLTAEDLADLEERLYDTREAIRRKDLDDDLAALEHRKAMGQLTVHQEIATLQQIIDSHQLAADELQDLQERMYDLQQQQQQQQQEALQTQQDAIQRAYDKIVQALKNRLNEEKAAELVALDDKIKMLQAQTDAEKAAQQQQDYEERLADKQRQLRLTKSARERRELQAEIDDMITAEQLRKTQEARQAEINALRDEKTAVQDKYADLTNEENLRQEALRMVMSNNLQAMADLITSYGPKWENAGALLADYLTQGIVDQGGLAAGLQGIMDDIKSSFLANLQGLAGGATIPRGGVMVQIQGDLYVREEADVDKVAAEILYKINRAG